jgi:dTDP-4-amino-4,6-dideoxygalactose transaminase
MTDAPIYVTRPSMPPFDEYCAEIKDLWVSRFLTNFGKKHLLLEQELKRYLGVDNLSLIVNGHLALESAVESLSLPAGGEVITTPFTFSSTTHAIVRKGLTPVFCDVKPDSYVMDPALIEPLITRRTVAILPVHVYGVPCDVERIGAIAKEHRLKVIYDAAHAFGVKIGGVPIAAFGDVSMFSFHATKVFHTIEGGGVVCTDPEAEQRLSLIKRFGTPGGEDSLLPGTNAKMNELQAAMGICNLRHMEEYRLGRKRVSQRYDEYFSHVPGLQLLPPMPDVERNYSYYPLVIGGAFPMDRDQAVARLEAEQIYARKYFCPPTNRLTCYQQAGFRGNTPVSDELSRRILCLPLYPDLTNEQVDRIASILLDNGSHKGL